MIYMRNYAQKGNNVLNGYVVYQIGENNELHVYNLNECLLNAYNERKFS